MKNRSAFTLIELLVVVLIIGILAAVAFPQYKLVVVKSQVATILPVLKSISDAEEVYYLANGQYTNNVNNLDVHMPGECTPPELNLLGNLWTCGNFLLDIMDTKAAANYCPFHSHDYYECVDERDFQVRFHYQNNGTNVSMVQECLVANQSALGQKICNSLVLH